MTKPSTPTAKLLRERLRIKLQDAGLSLDWMAMLTDNDVAAALCSWKSAETEPNASLGDKPDSTE